MEEKIKNFIETHIIKNKELSIDYNTSLYKSGLISSMSHIKLMNFLEYTYSVNISSALVDMNHFDTINNICQTIRGLQKI